MSGNRQTQPQQFPVHGGPWNGRRVTFMAGDPPDGTPVAKPRDFKRNSGGGR